MPQRGEISYTRWQATCSKNETKKGKRQNFINTNPAFSVLEGKNSHLKVQNGDIVTPKCRGFSSLQTQCKIYT